MIQKIRRFFFENTGTKQTIIKNTFWLIAGEFGMRILKLFLFIYATRKLGITEWGLFSYTLAVMGFFGIISDIGINSVLLRETAQGKARQPEYISTSFFLKLGLSVFSSLSLLCVIIFLADDSSVKVLIPLVATLLLFESIQDFGFSLNRAFERMEVETIIKIGSTILLVTLGFIFIEYSPKSSSLLYAYVVSSIIGTIIIYFRLRKHLSNLISNFKEKLLLPIWKEAWPLGTATALGGMMATTDIIILGWYSSVEQIGIYSAAQKLALIIYLLPTLLGVAILPTLSKLAASDLNKMRIMVNKVTKYSVIFTLPIIIGCFLFGDFVFNLLFGEEYAESASVFRIMSLAIVTIAPSTLISNAMFAEGKQNKLIRFVFVSLAINIILCLLAIPYFGIEGAAVSSTVAYIVGNLMLINKYRKLESIPSEQLRQKTGATFSEHEIVRKTL
ncbi:MAG: flippase [bacterium]|nr:flippase [bacterium]